MSFSSVISMLSDISVIFGAGAAMYGINTWKREVQWRKRSELAEKALYRLYEVESAINSVRNPMSSSSEWADRTKRDGETKEETHAYDMAYVVFARLDRHSDTINEMRSIRQRCRVIFGDDHLKFFDDLYRVIVDIQVAARRLTRYWLKNTESWAEEKRDAYFNQMYEFEDVIWGIGSEDDPIGKRIKKAIAEAESFLRQQITPVPFHKNLCKICKPYLKRAREKLE